MGRGAEEQNEFTPKPTQMEHLTLTNSEGEYDDDTWDQENEGSGGQVKSYALSAARAHLAAVAEELATIQSHFSDGRIPARSESSSHQGAMANQAQQDLERSFRHMQVDLEQANARADRLAQEKEELLNAQARLEADLRAARQSLETMRLRVQHLEVDQRKQGVASEPMLGGEEFISYVAKEEKGLDSEKPPPVSLRAATEPMLAPRPAMTLSKQQAVAALRAVQVELMQECKRRARLEQRVQKDQERLERVVAVAEAQQKENRALQKRYLQAEAHAQGCLSRLYQVSLQASRPDSSAEATLDISTRHLATPPFGGYVGNQGSSSSASMTRQKSAPTRLPNVATKSI
mmetsp:Transcript_84777/g.133930  ORF Transcript_84777/g.133930 Transcript_84777/m.133930 type:complete len:347 (-) Transcript_84777:36-1076(-)|eukprot:CAMPEP_0169239992 /NCGR_PEP_ID=MMETSP1016-20121227/31210_1 /TAXON_ID=342587 /ORGANISM="Karlodinium micrum, Strain CCMP2283" /LENGTH=346 /DNA_ID=CAMNT_0009319969 /DNA_START=118 /DNA_END=1158 /DNA_ORIENTATION=-